MKAIAYEIMADAEESYWWYRARRKILADVINRLAPPGNDIVDMGAGTGGTAALLLELGYRVVAADVSESALEACRMRGLETVDLKKERLRPGAADCILAGDVLEHVEDEREFLLTVGSALRRGGLFLATVPSYEFLWSGEDFVSEHVRRYTRAGLKRQLQLAGFEVLRCSYFNTLLLPAIVAVILTKRLCFPREMYKSNVARLPGWQNEMLYKIFAAEASLLRWMSFPAGASVLAIARFVRSE